MKMLGLSLIALMVTQSALARFIHCDSEINVIAPRLAGNWHLNPSLSTESNQQLNGLSFHPDGSVLPFFTAINTDGDVCAYSSGYMDLFATNGKFITQRPYVLTEHGGMPLIVWLEKFGDEGFDHEVFQTFIITGESTDGFTPSSEDMLIIGGDSNNGSGMLVFARSDGE